MGTIHTGDPVLIDVRSELCERRIVKGAFLDIDMRAYACNTACRGISCDQLISSPFINAINAEVYVVDGRDTLAIPLWKVNAIVMSKKIPTQ